MHVGERVALHEAAADSHIFLDAAMQKVRPVAMLSKNAQFISAQMAKSGVWSMDCIMGGANELPTWVLSVFELGIFLCSSGCELLLLPNGNGTRLLGFRPLSYEARP